MGFRSWTQFSPENLREIENQLSQDPRWIGLASESKASAIQHLHSQIADAVLDQVSNSVVNPKKQKAKKRKQEETPKAPPSSPEQQEG